MYKVQTSALRCKIRKGKLRCIVLCLLFLGLLCKRTKTPTAIIYALTPEQVYFNSSPDQVLRVFREERFSNRANFQVPLFEVRAFKNLFYSHPNFTFDVPIHILHKVLARRSYLRVLRSVNKEISKTEDLSVLGIKSFKYHLFDPVVYSALFAKVGSNIDLITTQSSFFKVPSSFITSDVQKKIMAWYSTNSKPIYATDDKQREGINVDAFKRYVNEHWVWNQEEVNFLQTYEITNAVAVGPIIFQDKIIEETDSNKFVITYFDVTPIPEGVDFYSEKNATAVLTNILRIVEILGEKYPEKMLVQIKPKRKYSKFYSKEYISLVKISSRLMKIKCLSASANIYRTISKTDLVLAIPFTSPALVAKELKINSFFVSTGIDGWDIPSSSGGIPVVFSFEELLSRIEKELNKKFTP